MADIFTGASRYSSDFQSVIDRAVNIASLPMLQMQQGRAGISDQSGALKAIESKVASLESTLKTLGDSFGFGSYSVANSNASVVSARISEGVTEGTYSIKVLDVGSYATASSRSGLTVVTDPATQNITSDEEFTLHVNNGTPVVINPASNNLNSLVEAINASNAGVRATVVNLSPTGSPEYHLSLQSTSLGPADIRLTAGSTELLDNATGGTSARYVINGSEQESISNSRTVTVSNGLVVDLVRDDDQAATIEVTRGTTNTRIALESFVNSYNSVIDELNKHFGTNKGALSGNSIVRGVEDILRKLGSYASNDSLGSLAAIGIAADEFGKLSLDSVEWGAVKTDFTGLKAFMGSLGGTGFLKAAEDQLASLRNTTNGILATAIDSFEQQIETSDARLIEEQRRIDDLKESLQKKFYAADALIASLEQQASYFINMFAAMKANQESMN
jgi:flagellar hook-associated protein 2